MQPPSYSLFHYPQAASFTNPVLPHLGSYSILLGLRFSHHCKSLPPRIILRQIFPLARTHVKTGPGNASRAKQQSSRAVSGPNPSVVADEPSLTQHPRAAGLKRVHHALLARVRPDHSVNVIRAHIHREQSPVAKCTRFTNSAIIHRSRRGIQDEGFPLLHPPRPACKFLIIRQTTLPEAICRTICRTPLIPRVPGAERAKGQQVRQRIGIHEASVAFMYPSA